MILHLFHFGYFLNTINFYDYVVDDALSSSSLHYHHLSHSLLFTCVHVPLPSTGTHLILDSDCRTGTVTHCR